MVTRKSIKPGTGLAAGLLLLSLAATPAQAHDARDVIAPAAAFIALGWMLHQGHHGHHRHYEVYKRYRHHGHGHHGHKGRYGGHYRHHRQHSHSHGGYHKKKHRVRH